MNLLTQCGFVACQHVAACTGEDDLLQRVEPIEAAHGSNRGRHRELQRIPVRTAADRRKRDRGELVRDGKLERAPIARGEQLRLAVAAAMPYRADRVNDMSREKPVSGGNLGLSR